MKRLIILTCMVLLSATAAAQERDTASPANEAGVPATPAAPESLAVRPRRSGHLELDFPELDGMAVADSLEYEAESVEYHFDERTVVFTGKAGISYTGRTLASHRIIFYQDYNYLEAVGRTDSTGALVDTPVFTDLSGEEMHGERISYDMESQKGYVTRGRSAYESGFMSADRIKRAAEDTLYIADGRYTTCDIEDHPHYYFGGERMKFIVNDKLIIKPVVAYLHDIPVMWFPFYVFPIKQGRQSGFLTPRYGSSRLDGRYLSNVGYYYAPNDYVDYKAAGTVRERNGWMVKNWFNYNRRYSMSGSIFGSYENRTAGAGDSRQWKLNISHSQTVSPTLSISARGQFESSSYSRYNSRNLYEQINRNMESSLSMTKRWRESGNSLIASSTYNRNLDSDAVTMVLPSVSFRKQRSLLFGGDNTGARRKKYTFTEEDEDERRSWYESVYYTLNTSYRNTMTDTGDRDYYNRELDFSSSLSSSSRLMGWLVAEPSLNLNESFTASNSDRTKIDTYERSDNLSARMSLNTTVYGMFAPNIGSITALRHVMNPSISYSYGLRRRFAADDFAAFYRVDENDLGNGRVNSVNLNLRNILEAKAVEEDRERKINLFTLNFSSGVNFEEDDRPVSPLSTTLDVKPFRAFSTRLTARHSFYDDNDRFDITNPYLDTATISTSIGMDRGMSFLGTSRRGNANARLGSEDFEEDFMDGEGDTETSGRSGGLPFTMNISHTYGIRRSTQPGKDDYPVTHSIKPTVRFSPTSNFSVNYYIQYNVEDETIAFQRMVVNRDLHCWEASLSWIPGGTQQGFYLKVNIKELPDVKIEQRRGRSQVSY